jgi:cytochrome c oxidase subunit 2
MKFIALIVIVLAILAVAQLTRIYELTSKLRNRNETDVDYRDNKMNANLLLLFGIGMFVSYIWMIARYGAGGNSVAASVEGVEYDWLFGVNMILISAIFFVTNGLLFYFAWKYHAKPGAKAYYYTHNTRWELMWTAAPAAVLSVIIVMGLVQWSDRTGAAGENAVVIELYSKQFDWAVRYSGQDNTLGKFDYKLINTTNPLGLATTETIAARVEELKIEIEDLEARINDPNTVYSVAVLSEMKESLATKERLYVRLLQLQENHDPAWDASSLDDIVQPANITLVLKKNQEYDMYFRAQDVIHSAYFPHFRAQINTVPGMVTRLKFTPSITTKEMRKKMNDNNFNYILLCNKICGASHSNMKLIVEVLDENEYDVWWAEQVATKTFGLQAASAPESAE